MRKLTFLMLVVISLLNILITEYSFAQYYWTKPVRITSGYKDSNPEFTSLQSSSFGVLKWEFLIFQRAIDTTSQICVLKFNAFGPMDTVRYLTADNYINRNPSIAYRINNWIDSIKTAFAVWETNRNNKWDLYGAYFTTQTGWTTPFPIDTTPSNKFNPKGIIFTAGEGAVTYSRDGEIIYRRINVTSGSMISETNLTSTLTQECIRPSIGARYNNCIISFSAKKSDNTYSLYKILSTNSGTTWGNPDTITTVGNNFSTTVGQTFNNLPRVVYESNKNGNYGIFHTEDPPSTPVLYSPNYNYYGLKYFMVPFITEQFYANLSVCIRKSADSTKLIFDQHYTGDSFRDSVTIGDSSKKVSVTVNQGIHYGDAMIFAVYNKDSAGFTNLYYKRRLVSTGDINFTGNYIAGDYRLHQNYPNPFNPTTKIKFDIPKLSDVKIVIFDAVGREVKNITQNNMTAGSYEYEFNGENLSSGIYYFKLQTSEFNKTVKMVLVK